MPAEPWTPERRRQRTREALLDAAVTVFAKRGFHGASLDEIAETAGYTRGAIYKYFADKEQLLHDVCVMLNERTFAEFDEVPSVRLPISEYGDSNEFIDHWRAFVERDAEFRMVMLEFLLYAMRNPKVRERAREFGLFNRDQIVAYLQQLASENGEELPLPIGDLAGIFGITSDGFAEATLIDPDAARLFGLTIDLLVRGIRSYASDPPPTATTKPRAPRTRAATTRSAGRRDRG